MEAIVIVDEGWGIGKNGKLMYHLRDDLRYFSLMTRGKVMVMGSRTLQSFPGGKPLKDRLHIVMSHEPGFTPDGVLVARSREELRALVSGYPPDGVILIGGETLYRQFIACCFRAYVTRVRAVSPADRFFPNMDEMPGWRLAECGPEQEQNGLRFAYCVYENSAVEPL
jgi:dihydrofolate reductase